MRGDSGFQNRRITRKLRTKGCLYSIGIRLTRPVAEAIEQIDEQAWRRLADYPDTGEAGVDRALRALDQAVLLAQLERAQKQPLE